MNTNQYLVKKFVRRNHKATDKNLWKAPCSDAVYGSDEYTEKLCGGESMYIFHIGYYDECSDEIIHLPEKTILFNSMIAGEIESYEMSEKLYKFMRDNNYPDLNMVERGDVLETLNTYILEKGLRVGVPAGKIRLDQTLADLVDGIPGAITSQFNFTCDVDELHLLFTREAMMRHVDAIKTGAVYVQRIVINGTEYLSTKNMAGNGILFDADTHYHVGWVIREEIELFDKSRVEAWPVGHLMIFGET